MFLSVSADRIALSIGEHHHPEPCQGVPRPAEAFVFHPQNHRLKTTHSLIYRITILNNQTAIIDAGL